MGDTIAELSTVLADATVVLAEALAAQECLRCIELEAELQAAEDEIASLESCLADIGELFNGLE